MSFFSFSVAPVTLNGVPLIEVRSRGGRCLVHVKDASELALAIQREVSAFVAREAEKNVEVLR